MAAAQSSIWGGWGMPVHTATTRVRALTKVSVQCHSTDLETYATLELELQTTEKHKDGYNMCPSLTKGQSQSKASHVLKLQVRLLKRLNFTATFKALHIE